MPASSYLPKLQISFDENHGGKLQQTHNDGALAEVVLVHLARAEVGRPLSKSEAALGRGQVMSCQFAQEEMHRRQEARILLRAWPEIKSVIFLPLWRRRSNSLTMPTEHEVGLDDVQADESVVAVQGGQQHVHPLQGGPDAERARQVSEGGLREEAAALEAGDQEGDPSFGHHAVHPLGRRFVP